MSVLQKIKKNSYITLSFWLYRISEGTRNVEDYGGYIRNLESTIDFGIDERLMEILDEYGIDTNPKDGIVRFELNCQIEQVLETCKLCMIALTFAHTQGTNFFVQRESVRLNIEKTYDNGALPADTIGIIVGCIFAVLLLIVAVAVLVSQKMHVLPGMCDYV